MNGVPDISIFGADFFGGMGVAECLGVIVLFEHLWVFLLLYSAQTKVVLDLKVRT